jgi:hypothetical protein
MGAELRLALCASADPVWRRFVFVEGRKIAGVQELTRLVRGDAADRDLGSRRSGA